ncbi:MAG: CHAD domain-containing protein [Solirubrobacterales bacterium]|nr:CHAD domain-containing protein [Solirubrobacterales bacterium]
MSAGPVDLLLPDGVAATAIAAILGERLDVEPGPARTVERTYLESFDGRLHDAGLALTGVDGRLVLVDAATHAERAVAEHMPRDEPLLLAHLEAGALRDTLAPVLEMRAVTPVARVRSRLRTLNVLDEERKTVARVRVEEPTVLLGARKRGALRGRVHLLGVRGYDRALERVRDVLVDELGAEEAPRPVQDDAIAASGGTPGGISSKLGVAPTRDQRADEAAALVLRRLLDVVDANLPGTLADVDTEFLHDLRVAIRRTRALQRELPGVFEPRALRRFRDRFRDLQQLTGPTRDLDVHLLDFEELASVIPADVAPDLQPVRTLLEQRRAAEQRAMVRALRSARSRRLLDNWGELVDGLPETDEAPRPDAGRPIADVASTRIRKVYKRMVRMGRAIDDASPSEDLHDLRKKGKELRYLLEFFSALYPDEVVKPLVKSLKALQDVLGRHQDREVQAHMLRRIADDVAALDRGAAALMAMGLLAERLGAEQMRARAQFAESFATFAAKDQRALVKETFG